MSDDEEHKERATAETYGKLETRHADEECWLIRVPAKLAELMDAVPEGTELGELVFTKGGKVAGQMNLIKPSLTVHLREDAATLLGESTANEAEDSKPASTASIPLNYSLESMTKKIPLMHPMDRHPITGSVEIFGQITRTANLQVEQDLNYRAMLKDRLVATNVTSQRFVKPVEATETIVSKQQQQRQATTGAASSRGFGAAILEFGKRQQEQSEHQKAMATIAEPTAKKSRQFGPGQALKSIIFDLFSQRQYWTLKELKAAAAAGGAGEQLAAPKADKEVKDILREIAVYHKTGERKTQYELKKEYQQGGGDAVVSVA